MPDRKTVMISSTARDLPKHRQAVMDACLRQGMFPLMMEHLPASDADAIEVSLKIVEEADIYLGIFGHRYGYVPEGYDIDALGVHVGDRAAKAPAKSAEEGEVADAFTPILAAREQARGHRGQGAGDHGTGLMPEVAADAPANRQGQGDQEYRHGPA